MEQQFFKENWEARLNALLNWSEIRRRAPTSALRYVLNRQR